MSTGAAHGRDLAPLGVAPPDDRYYTVAASVAADFPKLVLKHDDSFLVADDRGDFPGLAESECGFYVRGTRYLQSLELRLYGDAPIVLNAALSEDRLQLAADLTNPDVLRAGQVVLPARTLRMARVLALYGAQLSQSLVVESFAGEAHDVALHWNFVADFVDVFEVRGLRRPRRGSVLPFEIDGAAIRLAYRGLDGIVRATRLTFDPPPDDLREGRAFYRMTLPPGGRIALAVTITAEEDAAPLPSPLSLGEVMTRRRGLRDRLGEVAARAETSHDRFNEWLARSRSDLHMLLTETPDGFVPYAGIPWYVAPFGRDSIITALQVLPFEPEIARGTLRFLARHQGTVEDDFTDQQPGKILHEYRQGELANCREIPFIPYYGSVDATPLFLVLLAEYVRWTADLALARELWPAAERALDWIIRSAGDDGYLTYARRSATGLANQGWKDSVDAIMHASGSLAAPPIALAEVQGYCYAALGGAADVAEAIGQAARAGPLRERARRLRSRFEDDFWMAEEEFYALALDGEGRPCRVIASNAGHCLWSGIAEPRRARAVASRLMAPDLFTGWGVRTLSARERLYNPMSYHNGSVWPHDTGIVAAGLRAYGFVDAFQVLATGLFEGVLQVEGLRMPELFCGFAREPGYGPTRYPVACSPQAWSAGVVFQLLSNMLALMPDARGRRLVMESPVLPPWLDRLTLRGLRLADTRFDVLLERGRRGATVELLDRRGDADLLVRK